ncbi:MAG: hypothetical protein AAGK14_03290 [Verrucomicrobiota bacterium]
MKSAYELAMEKLEQAAPSQKLTEAQRDEIAAIDEKFRAKIAERETFLDSQITAARAHGDHGAPEVEQLEDQKRREVAGLREDCEAQKEKVRSGS